MPKDDKEKDILGDFLVEEDPAEVQKRIDDTENEQNTNEAESPWNTENKQKEKQKTTTSQKNKTSASKSYFFLIIIILAIILGLYIYNLKDTFSSSDKSLLKSKEILLLSNNMEYLLKDIDYELQFTEWQSDDYIMSITNLTSDKIIKEILFSYKSGTCEEAEKNENNWFYEKLNTFIGPNTSQRIKAKKIASSIDVYSVWCIREELGGN